MLKNLIYEKLDPKIKKEHHLRIALFLDAKLLNDSKSDFVELLHQLLHLITALN